MQLMLLEAGVGVEVDGPGVLDLGQGLDPALDPGAVLTDQITLIRIEVIILDLAVQPLLGTGVPVVIMDIMTGISSQFRD